jgi:HD-GYP domain-containing protein (c-di-GMP phosphodiesterase class II)
MTDNDGSTNINPQYFTDHADINQLLNTVVDSVRNFTESQAIKIRRMTQIGLALSAEHDLGRLLEMIVDEARRFTCADGGTLYIVSNDDKELAFAIVQNDSLKTRMGGTSGAITWPPVPLYHKDGTPNHANVSSFAALSGETVNIPDVYHTDTFNFEGTRSFDAGTGYRSRSMLVVPLRNHEDDIIGVLQLLNAKSTQTGEVIPFSKANLAMTESLASQAAVALTNNLLIKDLQALFEAFIKTIATAIDEKSPYTGDHGRRVVELTMLIAEAVNASTEPPFKDVYLNDAQLNELRIAAWLHDVGKVAIPEYVMDKSTKLEGIFDRMEIVKTRFEVVKRDLEIARLRTALAAGGQTGGQAGEQAGEQAGGNTGADAEYEADIKRLEDDLAFLATANQGGEFMSDQAIDRIRSMAGRTWHYNGTERPLLDDEEIENLSIRKGTLNTQERDSINNHAMITHKMLSQLPFPKKMRQVPLFAATHHECLNGRGYPFGLTGEDLTLQSRIMAIADIFEALTARDRPYRKANTVSGALKILGFMVKDGHLDGDLYELFVRDKVYAQYNHAQTQEPPPAEPEESI